MSRYGDRLTHPLPTTRDMWRILREGGFRPDRADRANAQHVPRVQDARLPAVTADEAAVTWVGHATTVVQLGGRTFVTDPVWRDGLPGRIPRLTPPGIAFEHLGPVDGILVSHNHYDHMDAPTLARFPRDTPVFVPAGTGRWARRKGFTEVHEMDWWESVDHRGVRVTFVPSHHWTRRGLLDTNAALWGGWVLSAPGQEPVHFAGDTAYGGHFKEIRGRLGPMGTTILPIGAYEPRWFMKNVHMDPDEAVRACSDLEAKRMVAMHWGTFPLTREPILEPPQRARAAWLREGRPESDLWILALGEGRVIPASP